MATITELLHDMTRNTFYNFYRTLIFTNVNTEDDVSLNKCCKFYNNMVDKIVTDEMIVKIFKYYNLQWRVHDHQPLNARNAEHVEQFIKYPIHESLIQDDMMQGIAWIQAHGHLKFLTTIPNAFLFGSDTEYKPVLWQYLRHLFFVSQLIVKSELPDEFAEYFAQSYTFWEDSQAKLKQLGEMYGLRAKMDQCKFSQITLKPLPVPASANVQDTKKITNMMMEFFGMEGDANEEDMPLKTILESVTGNIDFNKLKTGDLSGLDETMKIIEGDVINKLETSNVDVDKMSAQFQKIMSSSKMKGIMDMAKNIGIINKDWDIHSGEPPNFGNFNLSALGGLAQNFNMNI